MRKTLRFRWFSGWPEVLISTILPKYPTLERFFYISFTNLDFIASAPILVKRKIEDTEFFCFKVPSFALIKMAHRETYI